MINIPKIEGMTPGAYGIFVLVALALAALIKAWPSLRKMNIEADGSLRSDLMARIGTLEKQISTLEAKMGEDQERHAAEMQIMRHRLNNETAALDALLLLLEAAPEKVAENITRIKEMRHARAQVAALESGAMAGAAINGKVPKI
jgi:peptidoglycan hydrolase CwlO-like protein